eukprot:CAMPEP_0201266614 /NCGR_PEP_ID=MMETSP0853-20130426/21626_1 /ASSEMBLY_ACC=CAM_ASM_000640 /TAXON_ID=183588 /ORGANISM="Pseudo-nitzschia fraudulenta, Strain WWA7" /LENGTH=426 /DNA_ID=CAMNT_0047571623 /DNA_START=1 /DNA_END=1281 /DNA_ORIENTATION=-
MTTNICRRLAAFHLVTTALLFGGYKHTSTFASAFRCSQPTVQRRPRFDPKKGKAMARARTTASRTTTRFDALPVPNVGGAEKESLRSLFLWIGAFSSSHIGMSAIRQRLITDVFGGFLASDVLGIVGTGRVRLPDAWPGDSSGTNELFPDIETTGRQFYRAFYTMVSFLTLGTSFSIYLALGGGDHGIHESIDIVGVVLGGGGSSSNGGPLSIILCYVVATLSGAFSLASLVNASPLGLMPSFRPKESDDEETANNSGTDRPVAGDTLLGITRDDELKFDPRGLTRITRHPLILPVFPWGIATSLLVGGRPEDAILLGGLSLYAVAGCYCQDLRVLREEGSVGTTFFSSGDDDTSNPEITTTNQKLRSFYDETSFVPFGALADGRQSWESMAKEFPILPFLIAIPSAFAIETVFLRFLGVEYNLLL